MINAVNENEEKKVRPEVEIAEFDVNKNLARYCEYLKASNKYLKKGEN